MAHCLWTFQGAVLEHNFANILAEALLLCFLLKDAKQECWTNQKNSAPLQASRKYMGKDNSCGFLFFIIFMKNEQIQWILLFGRVLDLVKIQDSSLNE